jgi:hypothetical protein
MRRQSFFRLAVASCILFATGAFLSAQSRIATQTHVRRQDPDASRLDELIAQNRYLELQRDLCAAQLSTSNRAYFEGIVADRTHNVADAIALLGKALPDLKAHSANRAALALRALASDYFEAGRYGDSANAYAALLKNYRSQFHADDLQGFSDNLHTYEMLRGAPAQVVAGATGFIVATRRDPLGNTDVPVTVGKTEMWWMFDTGANISTISLSTATRLGLTLSRRSATTQSGATGNEVPFAHGDHSGTPVRRCPHPQCSCAGDGRQGTRHQPRHQRALFNRGNPLISALGSFTIFDDKMEIAAASSSSTRCAPLYVQDLTALVVVHLQAKGLVKNKVYNC